MTPRLYSWLLLLGDFALLFVSLALTLVVRSGPAAFGREWNLHLLPFAFLNVAWIVVYYICDLYSHRSFRVTSAFLFRLGRAAAINALVTIIFFYLIPAFGITPKTILILDLLFANALIFVWRWSSSKAFANAAARQNVAFVELDDREQTEMVALSEDPECWFRACEVDAAEILVVGGTALHHRREQLYAKIANGMVVFDAAGFSEEYRRMIPLALVDEAWLLNAFSRTDHREFELPKRAFDAALSAMMLVLLSPVFAAVAALVKSSSPGPIFFTQTRVGRFGALFTIYKFRSMRTDAEANGAQWAVKDDPRVTKIGKILRHTHLDELPQLMNVLRGDMSFVGPRPERPEFVELLARELPFYALRHLVRPGITGWAQVNAAYSSDVEGARRKLAYDLYYVKNRSWLLETKILLKTAAMVFRGEGR